MIRRTARSWARSPALPLVLILALAPLLVACGGGGGGGAGATPGLSITTTSLSSGTTLAPYPTTQLEAVGGQGPLTWTVTVGTTPNGVDLSPAGVLSGTPTQNGTFDFTVEVDDTVATDTQALTIVVTNLTLVIDDGLRFGDAWTQVSLSLSTIGMAGTISFSTVSNASGGSFSNVDGAAGTATWTPGSTGNVTDVLRATDLPSGEFHDLVLDVALNPIVNHTAGFGTNDVWWVSMDVKRGTHVYTTDFHKALVDIGMWPAASTGPATTDLELLVELLVRVQILREMNLIYLRESDGTPGGDGLAISFPYEKPEAGTYSSPPAAQSLSGSSSRYSVMEIADADGQPNGVLGVAILDPNNNDHEHDGGSSLGVLVDAVTGFFIAAQGSRPITGDPISTADIGILKALIYAQAGSGARYTAIKNLVEYYARALALVAAHEIGHSLGMDHNGQNGSLMNDSISFGNQQLSSSNAVPLTTSEVQTLQTDLPGPGRNVAPLLLFGTELPHDPYDIRVVKAGR